MSLGRGILQFAAENMNCPVCSSSQTRIEFKACDDRYGYPGEFDLVCCQKCAHRNTPVTFSASQLTELYSKYYPRSSFDIEKYQPHREIKGFKSWFDGAGRSTFRWIPCNVRILDIGCGFGESLGYHTARGCDVYGIEVDQNIQRVADKFGYKVRVGLFDPELYQSSFFDYVTMDQVIEHIINPVATLQGISQVLKHGGTLIISTPNANGWGAKIFGRKWINWHIPYHTQFFSEESMSLAAEKAGLQLEEVKTITSSEWLLYQWIHLFTYPQHGVPSIFWGVKNKKNVREKLLMEILSLLHKSKINHLVTRLFDSCGVGDNFVFVLRKP